MELHLCQRTTVMCSQALSVEHVELLHGLPVSLRAEAGACGGTSATASCGLPARLAWLSRPRFVDREGEASDVRAVEGVNGAVRLVAVRHFDEAKAGGGARFLMV